VNAAIDFIGNPATKAMYAMEQDVIAGCIADPERLGKVDLNPVHFTFGPNRDLWAMLLGMQAEGEPIDAVTLAARCEESGKRECIPYLFELVANFIDANWEHKAERVYKSSKRADFWASVEHAVETRDEATIVAAAEAITQMRAPGSRRAVQADVGIAYQSMRDEWAAARLRTQLTWGLKGLDKAFKPMQPTRLYVAAARPGGGKTALAVNVALANARAGRKVGFISIEMSMEELTARMLCAISGRPEEWIRGDDPQIPLGDIRTIDEARKELVGLPIIINDQTPMSLPQLQTWARSLVQRQGCELLIVDYIQKVTGTAKERRDRVSDTAEALKDIARQHKVPVFALAQLRRDAEGRRPTMSDLGDSSAIEKEADLIMALHREPAKDENVTNNVTEILGLKNRHGPGDLRVLSVFRGECYRFEGYEGRCGG
jgi:replicative DNA helicase